VRIYRLDIKAPEGETRTEWFTSERQAVTRRLRLFDTGRLAGRKRESEIWPVEVPTRKAELVGWLNEGHGA